ncbi:unnamed protein product, partial [Prunus brigantina]
LDIHARLGPQRNVLQRLGHQGGQQDNHRNKDREERRSAVHSQRSIHERLGPHGATENLSQAQSTNTPPRQHRREGRPSQTNEEVNQRCQQDQPAMCVEDVEKLVNDRLRDLKTGENFEGVLRKEIDQANSTPFMAEIEQAALPKRFSTLSFNHFK